MKMSQAPKMGDKIKASVKKPTGEKTGTHAFSQKGKPAESKWQNPNGRK